MAETRDPQGWMWTHSGKRYWPAAPRVEDVCIEDIGHALSMLCRYTGHTMYPYSVAEHSVLVSLMVPPELALEALLHDASEAYLGDVSRPLKRSLPDYKAIEHTNDLVIRLRFNLPPTEHPLVKQADSDILRTEYRTLMQHQMPDDLFAHVPGIYRPEVRLCLWSSLDAEIAFLNRYLTLMKGRA